MAEQKKLSIVVTESTFDKAMASMFLATTGAGMGMEVHMFFSFFGLNLLKKGYKPSLPGIMGPMTGMFKKRMREVGIESYDEMVETALELEVNMYACSTSMRMMDITEDELMDGVKILGAAGFLDVATESDSQLFIG